ncbi:hypothetical protein AB0J30_15175 [Streptomyces microflavus]|uniref:hypothetical protein n=1 Tax=Streptomyces microflavus TaxID=1919 RepID=UPI003414CCA1
MAQAETGLWVLHSLIGLGLAGAALLAAALIADHLTTTRTHMTGRLMSLMPEPLVYALLAVVLSIALRCLHTAIAPAPRTTRPEPDGPPGPRRDYVACHRTRCGHMEWPQRETPTGPVCSHCNLPPAPGP